MARPREAEYRPRAALTAGAYLLKARKRVQTLTLVRPKRRARQRVLVPAAEPTSKVGSMTEVEIYTDGACRGNPGPGGWAALLIAGKRAQGSCRAPKPTTTNNRMELMAAIGGLGALKRRCTVQLYTDSKYVLQGFTEWLPQWKARGWRTAVARTCQESGFMGEARCGRGGAGYRMALGQRTFRPRRQ